MENIKICPLRVDHHDRGFLEVVSQLRPTSLDRERFAEILRDREASGVVTLVAELHGKVLGTASIFFERKFIRDGGLVGHIEDVVVSESARRLGIGRRLVMGLFDVAMSKACYKVILDTETKNVAFYESSGMHVHPEVNMRIDL